MAKAPGSGSAPSQAASAGSGARQGERTRSTSAQAGVPMTANRAASSLCVMGSLAPSPKVSLRPWARADRSQQRRSGQPLL